MAIAIKKQWLYLERDEEKRKEYSKDLEKMPIELRLYFDESGFDLNMIKEYGYELTFKRLLADRSGQRGKRISVLSAINHNNLLIAPMIFEGYTNKTIFKTYLEKMLLPTIKDKNMTIILDNASFHKGDDIKELIEKSGNNIKYLPPYSPDLNPIEKKWVQIKKLYRKMTHKFEDKVKLIDRLLIDNSYQEFS